MREPRTTAADSWSFWDTDPQPPDRWPALEDGHRADGFHIDRPGVKSVAGRLIDLSIRGRPYPGVHYGWAPEMHWALPRELLKLFDRAGRFVVDFWTDLHTEIAMAGMLIERAAGRYDLADNPKLGDIPLSELNERVRTRLKGDPPDRVVSEPSSYYPNGWESLELPKAISYGVGNMGADKAKEDLSLFYAGMLDPSEYESRAESLAELANLLWLRSRDLSDAPWYGEAADKAQGALRQIFGNVTALSAVCGKLGAAARRFEEIATWCRENFTKMADPDRSAWDEFWDFGGTADSRTRDFLAEPNNHFMQVYDSMPKRVSENLPGLLVTDAGLADLRDQVKRVENRPKNSEFQKKSDAAWLAQNKPRVGAYEKAEQQYG